MKCQKCNRTATFHITEMTDAVPRELHLCSEHAYEYLHGNQDAHDVADSLFEDLAGFQPEESSSEGEDDSLRDATRDLVSTDFNTCECCGMHFQTFRKTGKFGCAYDYRAFFDLIAPLLESIHGSRQHAGKAPKNQHDADSGLKMVYLNNQLRDAIAAEEYERAAELRDRIAVLKEKIQRQAPKTDGVGTTES
ncbi:MAG: UvrB/UvrC motif-containing protein [Planctomycetia bacterium]|nr:UvrB/UvrC motif-containing protein [Planctomycetia bacterium]